MFRRLLLHLFIDDAIELLRGDHIWLRFTCCDQLAQVAAYQRAPGVRAGFVTFDVRLQADMRVRLMQVAWSTWWLRRFEFGPFEWLWRRLAYGPKWPVLARAT